MMDPQHSVRIKFVNEEETTIETRITGGVVPRVGEKVCVRDEPLDSGLAENRWFTVKDVWWRVTDHPERKPDVVEVRLEPRDQTDG